MMQNKPIYTDIASFSKVSFDQFLSDMKDTFKNKYSDYEIMSIYQMIQKPRRATIGSCGYDIYSPIDFVINPMESIKIPTGLRCTINDGWGLFIYPRSGHGFKTGVTLANTIGVIDWDYCCADNEGHIMIKLTNNSCLHKTLSIHAGDAFAQGIFQLCGLVVNDNPVSKRTGGFGSTDATNPNKSNI